MMIKQIKIYSDYFNLQLQLIKVYSNNRVLIKNTQVKYYYNLTVDNFLYRN